MVHRRCAFPGCRNAASGPSNMSFHLVHSVRHKRDLEKWKEACGVEEFAPKALICEEHFENDDFVNPCYKTQGLKPTAIPKRNPKRLMFEAVDVDRTTDEVKPAVESTEQNFKTEITSEKNQNVRRNIVKVGMTQSSSSVIKVKKSCEKTAEEIQQKRVAITSLKKIRCRMCLTENGTATAISAFSSFSGETSLSNIIETCFGIRIEEQDFCTKICKECLVKVDVAWKLYSEFQSNRLALEEFCSLEDQRKVANENVQDVLDPVEKRPVRKRKKKADPDPDSGDSDSYSLPEHPFFTTQSKKVYNCHLCPNQFKKETILNHHLSFKHGDSDENRLCEYCAKFFHKYKLSNHLQHHVEQKKVICTVCSKEFHNTRNLDRHMVVHTLGERPYPCTLCDKSFTQSSYLKFHVQRDHPSEENLPNTQTPKVPSIKAQPQLLVCPACGQQFKSGKQLITHVESTHPGHPMDLFACEQCSERFAGVLQLRSHRLIYHSGQKFECDRCGLVFKSRGQLRAHRLKHEREGCVE